MRLPAAAIAIAFLISGCDLGNVREQSSAEARRALVAGGPDSNFRAAEDRGSIPRFRASDELYVTVAGWTATIDTATLVDVGTGCQYIVRALYQQETDISPRNEAGPHGPIQRCTGPIAADTDFVTLRGGAIPDLTVAIVMDQASGCQEIVGTLYQNSMFSTPRMQAVGGDRQQICRRS